MVMDILWGVINDFWPARADEFSIESILPASLEGKVIIVTGATNGIGQRMASEICLRGADVYFAARSRTKADKVISELKSQNPAIRATYLPYNADSLQDVYDSAKAFLATTKQLDVLINNAGTSEFVYSRTVDGVEKMFGVNHLAYFMFTTTIWPAIAKPNGRVVNVSSAAHVFYRDKTLGLDDVGTKYEEQHFTPMFYSRSKAANILFTSELARRADKVFVNCCHPGTIRTGLVADKGFKLLDFIMNWFVYPLGGISIEKGTVNALFCGFHKEIEEKQFSGHYFTLFGYDYQPSNIASDEALAERLWNYSAEFCVKVVPSWRFDA